MNIDQNVYPDTYHISVNDAISGINVITFSKNMAISIIDGNTPMGEPLNNSNCYAGFDPNARNVDCGQNLQCSVSINPNNNNQLRLRSIYSKGKTNLRWMIKTVSSGNNVMSYILRWTNIPGTYQSLVTPFNRDNQQTFYSQITKSTQNCYEGGSYSAVYDVFPVTEIDIDKIQVVPRFDITTLDFTAWDADGNPTSQSVGLSRRYYNEIKPADATEAGEYYNADLWEKGFYDEFDENGKIIRRTYVSGCECNLYYGSKRPNYNSTFSVTNNNMNNSYWNADGNRVVPNYTVMGLFPMKEYYDELSGSVMLGTYPGIQFSQDPSYYQSDNIRFTYNNNTIISSMSPAQGSNMLQRGNTGNSTISLDTDSDSLARAYTLICPRFVGNDEIEKTSNSSKFLFNEDGTVTYEANNFFGVVRESYPIKYLWATIASWGIWVVSKGSFATGEDYTIGTDFPDYLYHGEVLEDGTTTGVMLQGEDTSEIPVWEDIEYDPIEPGPPAPEPGPTPQETEPKYPGFPTLGSSTRIIPTAGVNFYALNPSLVSTFIQRLWSQPKNFYEAIQIAGNQVDSIFDYIQSFRYYPLRFDFSTDNVYPVIFGTGAVLKDADGDTNFQLSQAYPIQHTLAAGQWNLSNSIYHWRNNFLDYSPYLKMSIYLPFAGTIELSPEAVASHTDISAATITLLASFDIETGTITYYVINQANVLLAQKTAKVAIDLPLSGNNSAEQSAAILRAQFSTVKQLLGAGTSAVTGAATSGLTGVASAAVSTLGSVGDMYLQNSLAQRAVPVEVQGMGGTFSALAGGQYPYITINRQKVSNPPNYAHTTGYLVEGTYTISGLNGFTVCRNVDISGIGQATDKEKAQIKQILESGFYC